MSLFALLLLPLVTFADTNRRYEGVKTYLNDLAAKNPAVAKTFVLGDSDSGEKILGLRVGSGPVRDLVVATHHGNEYGSAEVALGFAKSLSANPLPGHTTFIVPVLNIDGYNRRNRYERDAGGTLRDPNRDYPGPCGGEGPFHLKSTRALANFIDRENIVSSATLHTYFPAVVYPWGFATHDLANPYPDIFQRIVEAATEESQYQIGNSTEVIYPANGAFEDYAFWKHGIWSILFELGYSHSPSENNIQDMIAKNVPGLRRMIETAPLTTAANHSWNGRCDMTLRSLDRHDE